MPHSNPVLLKIAQQDARYTKTEKFIYKFFLENTDYILTHSITEIAQKIGVSEAAITRFAKKVGYKGFNEMRLLFTHGQNLTVQDERTSSLSGLLSDYITHLKDTAYIINEGLLDEFIQHLENGHRVKFYATGLLGDIAEAFAFRLSRLGFSAFAYLEDYTISVDAVSSKKGDMVIAIDFSGEDANLLFAVNAANERGSFTAAVTHFSDSPLARVVNKVQVLPSTELLAMGDLISMHVAAIFLGDYYYTRLLMRDMPKYRKIDEKIREAMGLPARVKKTAL